MIFIQFPHFFMNIEQRFITFKETKSQASLHTCIFKKLTRDSNANV